MKQTNKQKILMYATLTLVFLLFAGVLIANKIMTTNAIKEQREQEILEEWLPENCKCLERNRFLCPEGFELKENICRNDARKLFTNILLACSMYNCSEEIYKFDFDKEKW